jgi:hypothetical protein
MIRQKLFAIFAGASLALTATISLAADPQPAAKVKIAVFDFELEDTSAGGGIIAQDSYDTTYLAESTAKAKSMLEESGRYVAVSTANADLEATKKFGIRNCGNCEAGIALKLGADEAMTGTVTRVNRTEYTLLIRILDAHTGSEISTSYTNLRMGANYAWPRGVKWLMENQVLTKKAGK